MKSHSRIMGLLCISMVVAIFLGALGAHKLKDLLTSEKLESFQTGVLYHLIQTVALFAILGHHNFHTLKFGRISVWLIAIGTVLFSFSIYLLTCSELTGTSGINFILGPLTPVGGLLMIAGWGLLAINFLFYSLNEKGNN